MYINTKQLITVLIEVNRHTESYLASSGGWAPGASDSVGVRSNLTHLNYNSYNITFFRKSLNQSWLNLSEVVQHWNKMFHPRSQRSFSTLVVKGLMTILEFCYKKRRECLEVTFWRFQFLFYKSDILRIGFWSLAHKLSWPNKCLEVRGSG